MEILLVIIIFIAIFAFPLILIFKPFGFCFHEPVDYPTHPWIGKGEVVKCKKCGKVYVTRLAEY